MHKGILVAMALLPAIILCVYVYKKDRVEKEPLGLLLKLVLFGALSCFPAITLEVMFGNIIDAFFSPEVIMAAEFPGPLAFDVNVYGYVAASQFFGTALVEEGLKLFFLIWITKKNREFNSLFDSMIYAIFVSLGFAALENVFYVIGNIENGLTVALMRAVLSVPGHMFFAVLMGYYYGMWNMKEKAGETEAELISQGVIAGKLPCFSAGKEKVLTLLMPMLAHSFYNSCLTISTTFFTVLVLVFVIFMYVHCFGKIKEMSDFDNYVNTYVSYMLVKKYPELSE